jgi:DNA-binding NarL/FixJ family response regulator
MIAPTPTPSAADSAVAIPPPTTVRPWLITTISSTVRARRLLALLTPREHQVAAALVQGHSDADIAAHLHMSLATVKAHVSRLLAKLGAGNRVQIALLVQDATASGPPHPQ